MLSPTPNASSHAGYGTTVKSYGLLHGEHSQPEICALAHLQPCSDFTAFIPLVPPYMSPQLEACGVNVPNIQPYW